MMQSRLLPVPGAYEGLPQWGDNFILVILVNYREHTPEKPFCYSPGCGCHEDPILLAQVNQFVEDGLMTKSEATNFVAGKRI